jgi:FkbM family methyltransferase
MKSPFSYVPESIRELLTLKIFRNYVSVAFRAKLHIYYFKVISMKTKYALIVCDLNRFQLLKSNQGIVYCEENDGLQLNKLKKALIFYWAENNDDLHGIFYQSGYHSLLVSEKIEIDIGAYMGDSSINFINKGTQRALIVEPNTQYYYCLGIDLKGNVKENRITAFNSAKGCQSTYSNLVNLANISSALFYGIKLVDKPNENNITVRNINEMISEIASPDFFLKIDCEGCEYSLIQCIKDENYEKIEQIYLEYHFGVGNLSDILYKLGFEVSSSELAFSYVKGVVGKMEMMGSIVNKRLTQ